jgi:competence protein ComEC
MKTFMPSSSLRVLLVLLLLGTLLLGACRPDTPNESQVSEYRVSGQLEIHMLDVGQGDSLLIITPERKIVLIDAGLSKASDKVLDALGRYRIDHIDLAVATHPHADHIGGMPKVLTAIPVKMFLDSGQSHPTATYEKLLTTVKEKIGHLEIARAGQEFELDSGAKLNVLGPAEPLLENVRGSDENANSVVLRLSFGHFHMLFTGDSEEETEERLIESGADLRAQVLKVAHHGSRYATTEEFLNRVQPQAALISCGEDNDYGHPAQETLDRLYRFGVQLHRTDFEGEITIVTDGSGFQVTTQHAPTGDLWVGRTTDDKEKESKPKSKSKKTTKTQRAQRNQ